jgi:hypothetical protein
LLPMAKVPTLQPCNQAPLRRAKKMSPTDKLVRKYDDSGGSKKLFRIKLPKI